MAERRRAETSAGEQAVELDGTPEAGQVDLDGAPEAGQEQLALTDGPSEGGDEQLPAQEAPSPMSDEAWAGAGWSKATSMFVELDEVWVLDGHVHRFEAVHHRPVDDR